MRDQLVEQLPSLYRYLYRLCGEQHLAEDLAQEVALRAMKGLEQLESSAALRVWLFRIGLNAWHDHCRKTNKFEAVKQHLSTTTRVVDGGACVESDPAVELDQREQVERTRQAMLQLPERQRTVLILAACEELSHREIAEVLGISTDAVKSNLSVARAAMRKMFREVNQLD